MRRCTSPIFSIGIVALTAATILGSVGCGKNRTAASAEVTLARERILNMDTEGQLAELTPLVEKVRADGSLEYVILSGQPSRVLLIASNTVFRGVWDRGSCEFHADEVKCDGNPLRSPNQREYAYIQMWVTQCLAYGVCRIDARSRGDSIRVYVEPTIYFLFTEQSASSQFQRMISRWVESGRDYRGDICIPVAPRVHVATERR